MHPVFDTSRGRRGDRIRARPILRGASAMTQHPDLFAALAAPFERDEVKVRSQTGRQLHYITARTVMNRLDNVLGPENWWDEYVPGENCVLCELTIRLPDGSTLTKADAGGYAGMADSGDDDKSGFSDAFKRAAVKFGVARYLYRDGVPAFVRERTPGIDEATSRRPSRDRNRRPRRPLRQRRRRHGRRRPRLMATTGTAPDRQGALRLDEGSGTAPRGRALEVSQQLGQAPGLPRPDGRLGRRAGEPGLRRGVPEAPVDPGDVVRGLRGSPGQLRGAGSGARPTVGCLDPIEHPGRRTCGRRGFFVG